MSLKGGRNRAARSGVMLGLLSAVALQLGLNVALDTARPEWRDPEFGHRLREFEALRAAAPGRPVVVFVGSSRTQMGLDPGSLGLGDGVTAYNFGQSGCGPVQELLNVRRLLARGARIDDLLVEFLPPTLAESSVTNREFAPEKLGLADLRSVAPFAADPRALEAHWVRDRLAPWHTYRSGLLSHAGLGSILPWQSRQDFLWKRMRPGGWMPYFFEAVTPEKRDGGFESARQQYEPCLRDFAVGPTPRRAYAELLALAKAHGVRVGFMLMPESPRFRALYTPAAREALWRTLDELRAASGGPVFDLSAWRGDEESFADGHHLLRGAAGEVSRRFGAECVRPWLATK